MSIKVVNYCQFKEYIGSRCVDTHLPWLVYLSSVQASLTADIYPTHYGCKCILLPIIIKWSQPKADNHWNQPKGWIYWMVFDIRVRQSDHIDCWLCQHWGDRCLRLFSRSLNSCRRSYNRRSLSNVHRTFFTRTHSRSSWGPHNVHVMYKLIYTSSASACGICVKNRTMNIRFA